MARRDFLFGYMHAMRKVAGMSMDDFTERMLDPKETFGLSDKELAQVRKDSAMSSRAEQKAADRIGSSVKAPKLSGGGGGLGAAAIAGVIGIPAATGLGLYLLHRSRNK